MLTTYFWPAVTCADIHGHHLGNEAESTGCEMPSKQLGDTSLLPMRFAWAFLRYSWTRNHFHECPDLMFMKLVFFKKFKFPQALVHHYLRTTVVWRIAALWRVLGLLAWNGSSWPSPGAAVRKSDSKVSKGLWVLCLVCFNWFVFLLGLSQHTTRLCKVVYFNFQNFLVDRKHNQQTWSHFSSGKQDAKFPTLSCVKCGTTPQ